MLQDPNYNIMWYSLAILRGLAVESEAQEPGSGIASFDPSWACDGVVILGPQTLLFRNIL